MADARLEQLLGELLDSSDDELVGVVQVAPGACDHLGSRRPPP